MKYSWVIDQKAVVDSGLIGDLDVIDLSIFALFKDFAHSKQCKKMQSDGKTYYLFSWKLVVSQLPIIGIKSKRGITKRYEKLVKSGVIEPSQANQSVNGMWYCFGENYSKLIHQEPRNESTNLGTKVPTPRNESTNPPRNESTNYNIIEYYKSIEDKVEAQPPQIQNLEKDYQKAFEAIRVYLNENQGILKDRMNRAGVNYDKAGIQLGVDSLKGYLNKLASNGEWFNLTPPKSENDLFTWTAKHLAGWEKYMRAWNNNLKKDGKALAGAVPVITRQKHKVNTAYLEQMKRQGMALPKFGV